MARKLIVTAQWDDEASIWVATSDDIPGLVTEAESLDTLLERVLAVAPELLEDNSHLVEPVEGAGQMLDIRILSQFPSSAALATH